MCWLLETVLDEKFKLFDWCGRSNTWKIELISSLKCKFWFNLLQIVEKYLFYFKTRGCPSTGKWAVVVSNQWLWLLVIDGYEIDNLARRYPTTRLGAR